ncbi:hypothetical protein [Nocardia tengchongensis]|uniref:hypothetical protein n=1 Tax=Nocardia tengchongensis TaxID=2055889 RepID=UPI0036C4DB3B
MAAHSNDPRNRTSASPSTEFLATLTITVPEGVTTEAIDDRAAGEAVHADELAARGIMRRLRFLRTWLAVADYHERTATGLRHPAWRGLRFDLSPADVSVPEPN